MKKLSLSLIILVIFMQILVQTFKIPIYILPTPWQIMCAFGEYALVLWTHAWCTIECVLSALSLAVLMGLLMALFLDRVVFFRSITRTTLIALQSLPLFVLLPVLGLWMGHGSGAKILIVALSCFFPICFYLYEGLQQTTQEHQGLLAFAHATYGRGLFYVRLPASLPALFQGMKLAAIHAPITVIAVDWIGASEGLGYLILYAYGRLQMPLMFAAILLTMVLSIGLSQLVTLLQRRVLFWEI